MLEIEGLSYSTKSNGSTVDILKSASHRFERGRFYVITGPNGSGKSTLVKLIMGILKPSTGRILLDNNDITSESVTARARMGIGYSFQYAPHFRGMTVEELLRIAGSGDGFETDPMRLLLKVGLCPKDYIHREVDASLSGGELRRVELATVMARAPRVGMFDEPEAGIDLWSFRRLAEAFQEMHEETNTTLIVVSHQERILELADEILLVSSGELRSMGTSLEALAQIRESCACVFETPKGEEERDARYFG